MEHYRKAFSRSFEKEISLTIDSKENQESWGHTCWRKKGNQEVITSAEDLMELTKKDKDWKLSIEFVNQKLNFHMEITSYGVVRKAIQEGCKVYDLGTKERKSVRNHE